LSVARKKVPWRDIFLYPSVRVHSIANGTLNCPSLVLKKRLPL
jgi:hypothetical protein